MRFADVAVLSTGALVLGCLAAHAASPPDERANRIACANNLRQIHIAAMSYQDDQSGRLKYLPHVRGARELDEPADAARAQQMLVQFGYIDDCDVFLCRSMTGSPRVLTAAERNNLRRFSGFEPNDLSSRQLSYGWSRAARDQSTPSDMPIAADKAIRAAGDASGVGNHAGGCNVLKYGGQIEFVAERDSGFQTRIAQEINLYSPEPPPPPEPSLSPSAAIPEPDASDPASVEAAVIAALRAISAAESLFEARDADGDGIRDRGTLEELGRAGLIDGALASGRRFGYVFETVRAEEFRWAVLASPERPGGEGGARWFFADHSGAIRASSDGPASERSPILPESEMPPLAPEPELPRRAEPERSPSREAPQNEAGAIRALREISRAQEIFQQRDSEGDGILDYGELDELGQESLLDPEIASGARRGYVIEVVRAEEFRWAARADPERPGETGTRWFFMDQTGVIRASTTGPADETSPPLR